MTSVVGLLMAISMLLGSIGFAGTQRPDNTCRGNSPKKACSAPDTQPPVAELTSPVPATTVIGNVTIAAAATDDIGVVDVRFAVDGTTIAEDPSAPYTAAWDTTRTADGTRTVSATARDIAGNRTVAQATVEVVNQAVPPPDTTPPAVVLTAPTAGATVSASVSVAATATDGGTAATGVAGVTFSVDAVQIGPEDTTAPYAVSLDTSKLSDGAHTLRAVARDGAGNKATSATVSVTVSNAVRTTTSTVWPSSYFTGPAGQGNILPPRKGVLVGIHDAGTSQITEREQQSGRRFDLGSAFYQGTTINFDGKVNWMLNRGMTPVISYVPPQMSPAQLATGGADASYQASARAVAALKPARVMIRPFWEFNGTWMWFHAETPEQFKVYWKHMIDVFRAEGASNVSWIWSPDEGYRDEAFASYPGDAYVDWVASDSYNWYPGFKPPTNQTGWGEFWELYGWAKSWQQSDPAGYVKYQPIHDRYPQKPFMAAEFGTIEHPDVPGKKAAWITNLRTTIPQMFDHMYAIVYFDRNFDRDWRLTSSASALAAWADLVRDPYFNTYGL